VGVARNGACAGSGSCFVGKGLGFQFDPPCLLLEYGYVKILLKFSSKLTLMLTVRNKEWGEEGEHLKKKVAAQMV